MKTCEPSKNCNNIFVMHPFASHQDLPIFAKLQQHICCASIRLAPTLFHLRKIATTSCGAFIRFSQNLSSFAKWQQHECGASTFQPSQNCNNIFVAHSFACHQYLSTFANIATADLWGIYSLYSKTCSSQKVVKNVLRRSHSPIENNPHFP